MKSFHQYIFWDKHGGRSAWAAVRCWSPPRTPSSRSRPGNLVAASILEKCFPKSTFHEITTHFNWDVMKWFRRVVIFIANQIGNARESIFGAAGRKPARSSWGLVRATIYVSIIEDHSHFNDWRSFTFRLLKIVYISIFKNHLHFNYWKWFTF